MSLKPASPEAMQLLMEGSVAMSRIEAAGLRVDTAYLKDQIVRLTRRVGDLEKALRSSKECKAWVRHYGDRANLNSPAQLGQVVFGVLKHRRNPFARDRDTGKYKNTAASFEHLQLPFVRDYFEVKRLKKALRDNLQALLRETVDGYVHPFFDLHTTESYRSSSSRPNLQNFPVRNKDVSDIVRSAIIPRHDLFLEVDYGSQEVRVSCCYNKDPKLREYIEGGGDMHEDRAKEIYQLTDAELDVKGVGKLTRYVVKNRFVFPQFYGSYYGQCAPDLWDAISLFGLKRADGVSLHEHLKAKGITRLGDCDPEREPEEGTFERHVMTVERRMWKEVFTVYDQWKRDWWNLYLRQGGVNTLTGFRMYGVFRRNQVLCDAIQGSAFHCLLYSTIRIQKELIRRKMKSVIVNQVHDSLLFDAVQGEVPALVEMVERIAVRDVMRHWEWIDTPLKVEFEVASPNWFKKVPMTQSP